MTLADKLREVYRKKDPQGASDVADFCRFKLGWYYRHIVRAFGKANGLPEEEAAAEWEEIAKEIEEWMTERSA